MIIELICEAVIAGFETVLMVYWAKAFSDRVGMRFKRVLMGIVVFGIILGVSLSVRNPFILLGTACVCEFLLLYYANRRMGFSILLTVFFAVIMVISETLGGIIYTNINNINFMEAHSNPIYRLGANVISEFIALIFVAGAYFLKKGAFEMPAFRVVLQLIILPITSILIVIYIGFMQMVYENSLNVIFSVVVIFGLILANISIFVLFEREQEHKRQKEREKIFKQQIKNQRKYYQALEESGKEVRKIRHNLSNTLTVLSGYIENKCFEKAQDYLLELKIDIDKTGKTLYTGYVAIDSMLQAKENLAKKKHIPFEKTVHLPPKLPLKESDFCIVLGSALDNAIEACVGIKEDEGRIDLTIDFDGQALWLELENTAQMNAEEQKGKLYSRKKDMVNHGFGLRTIEQLVEENSGSISKEITEKCFKLNIQWFF